MTSMNPVQQRRERVVRQLNLLAYVGKHPDSTVMEMARDLGSDPGEIRDDLNALLLSGVGMHGGQMIDLNHDWFSVNVIDSQGLDKPLRLTPTEANALLLLLESLETMPGIVDADAVKSAAAKIRAVAHGAGVDDAQMDSEVAPAATIRQAIAEEKQLELSYYSATSNATSTRMVSPIDTFHKDGQTYLRAWDQGELRMFRFDRVRSIVLSDAASTPPNAPTPALDPADPFSMGRAKRAQLLIRRDATWLADDWDIDINLSDDDAEWVPAQMRYGNGDWLVRFCLGQAGRVRLQAPEELAGEVVRRAERAMSVLR